MITFIVSLALLFLGYLLYGKFIEHIFGPNPNRKTPSYSSCDHVDFIPMPTWKVFLIQFLNIAGTGPIFGAIQGILFGPAAYIWIVFGCIFGGAVHDYLGAMMSIRKNGASLPEIIGDELGTTARIFMRVFSLILMILVGAVFVTTPAGLLANMVGDNGSMFSASLFWIIIILLYYLMATLLPIDKLIGKIYPLFGIALLLMAVGMLIGILFIGGGTLPEITDAFQNHHPSSTMPIFPGLCITIACGAVSGFHATQSPMMARCIKNEKYGRKVFYGSMITEGLVALIWAAAAIKFADSVSDYEGTPYQKLWALMTNGGTTNANPGVLVNTVCHSWLGTVGAVLAILGVVAAPITTGDTAFRCARLIAADFAKIKQDKVVQRLLLCLPIFALSIILMFIDFPILWRYFGWFNQTLSVFTFWAITVYLARNGKLFLVTLIPALFMTYVCSTYICVAPEGFEMSATTAYIIGGILTGSLLVWFLMWRKKLVEHQQQS